MIGTCCGADRGQLIFFFCHSEWSTFLFVIPTKKARQRLMGLGSGGISYTLCKVV
jgi:hypothetical protein